MSIPLLCRATATPSSLPSKLAIWRTFSVKCHYRACVGFTEYLSSRFKSHSCLKFYLPWLARSRKLAYFWNHLYQPNWTSSVHRQDVYAAITSHWVGSALTKQLILLSRCVSVLLLQDQACSGRSRVLPDWGDRQESSTGTELFNLPLFSLRPTQRQLWIEIFIVPNRLLNCFQ